MISESQIAEFDDNGFFLIPNPLGKAVMQLLERVQRQVEPQWEQTEWPESFNAMACQFLMVGEPILDLVEQPELLEIARRRLSCDDIYIVAYGMGDSSKNSLASWNRDIRKWQVKYTPKTDLEVTKSL